MTDRLRGKVVLITGASAGIGEACAQQFADAGSNLILVARRIDLLTTLKADLEKKHEGIKIHIRAVDVRSESEVKELQASLPDELKAVDILVNNAGLAKGVATTEAATSEDVDVVFDTNVKGLMHFIRVFVPGMKERQSGHIINISSVAGTETYPMGSVYTGSKHAVHAITRSLRMELIATPLRVTSISPGLVETEFSVVRFGGDESRAKSVYKGMQPLVAADVADSVIYAASRPVHVQIADILIFPSNQASVTHVHREQL